MKKTSDLYNKYAQLQVLSWIILLKASEEAEAKNLSNFYTSISRGSCQEVLSQLYRALDYQYISEEEFTEIKVIIETTSVMIYNLIERLKKSDNKGPKYTTLNNATPL